MNDVVEDRFLDSAGPTLCQCCGTDGLGFEAGETRRTRDDLESQIQIQFLSEEDPIRRRQFKVQTKNVIRWDCEGQQDLNLVLLAGRGCETKW